MTSNFIVKDQGKSNPVSIVKGYYLRETRKTIFLKLLNGKFICFPKTTINTEFSHNKDQLQEFNIDDSILRKLGLIS
ncbi:MAG: hypothetical protein ACFE91_02015 [Promethearchaeota archaeon]